MRVALKLALAFILANTLLAALFGYLAIRHEIRVFERSVTAEAESVGPTIEVLVIEAWRSGGDRGVQELIHRATNRPAHVLEIRWVWFDSPPGSPDSPAIDADLLTTVATDEHQVIDDPRPDGSEYFRVYWPVQLMQNRRGALELSQPATELKANEREIVYQTGLLIGGMVLISGLLAAILGIRVIGKPLQKLTEKTRRVAAGDLEHPVHLDSLDELSELAESLNQMCARLAESQERIRAESTARIDAMDRLRHADRLTTVGRLAAGIAHELGTPLNVVAGRAALIQSGRLSAEEIGASAAAIKVEADKMTRIIRQLLDFARTSAPRKAPTDLRPIVERTIALLRGLASERRVRLSLAPTVEPAVAPVDVEQIQQVLTNLIVNAIQAMPDGGDVNVTIQRRTVSPPDGVPAAAGSYYGVEVCDAGVGISPDDVPHLFEPFFTTKGVGEGTGLGLSIAYGIVREHGGWIDVVTQPGKGSCFTVYLPEGGKS